TTGGSLRHTVEAVRAMGGEVVGAGVLIDRSGGTADAGAPYWATLSLSVPTYEPERCPECAAGLPLSVRGTSHL
ncbi:MAG: orotate phosphoribosyltransferase, partial [Chloroflexota bacterium]|nr:orotate phosphoribosyltransferase [Chloroflexota bacterium]